MFSWRTTLRRSDETIHVIRFRLTVRDIRTLLWATQVTVFSQLLDQIF
tara:strand:- start:913 stop:1056 length:144 start_codon:yes stop_codon:yes gene_type:complete